MIRSTPSTSLLRYAFGIAFAILSTAASAQPALSAELIFPLQDKHVHGSSLVECSNGDLLAAWFHGSGERSSNDVQILGARWSAKTASWSAPFPMADTPNLPDCNPVLFIDKADRLWLFWIVVQANRWEYSILKYRRADSYLDPGAPDWNWQDIIVVGPGADFPVQLRDGFKELGYSQAMWAEYARKYTTMLIEAAADPHKRQMGWMTRTKPMTLPSGRILLPLYSDGFNASLMAYSDDLGETWAASAPIIGLGPIQPSLARRKNGELVAYCRDSGDAPYRVMASTSTDDGVTWSVALDTDLANPGSSVAALTLRNGDWVFVYNDTERGRHRLAVALSKDEGETWPHKRYLDTGEYGKGSYAYPTAIQSSDDRVHVSYSYTGDGKQSIKHAAFDVDWIVSGAK